MTHTPRNFALIGAGGFVAPRHMRAIADSGSARPTSNRAASRHPAKPSGRRGIMSERGERS